MTQFPIALLVLGAILTDTALAADGSVTDAAAAIKKGRYVCRLKQPTSAPGQWQAVLVKNAEFGDEWHVWFGKRPEPICGFYGAVVKADGAYTSCAVTACKMASPKPN